MPGIHRFSSIMLSLALTAAFTFPAAAEGHSASLTSLAEKPFQLAQARVNDQQQGYSIAPPEGWKKNTASGQELLVYTHTDEEGENAGHMSLTATQDSTAINTLGPLIKAAFDKQGVEWELQDDGLMKVTGQDAYFINGLFNINNTELQVVQYYIQGKPGQIYILTFTVRASAFEDYQEAIEASAASFKLL